MYHEFRSGNKRDGWMFTYNGIDLLSYARERLAHYSALETAARETVAALLMDKDVAASDRRITESREAVERNGSLHEQLIVWVHEFARVPNREYFLSLGDVVFFGLQLPEPPKTPVPAAPKKAARKK